MIVDEQSMARAAWPGETSAGQVRSRRQANERVLDRRWRRNTRTAAAHRAARRHRYICRSRRYTATARHAVEIVASHPCRSRRRSQHSAPNSSASCQTMSIPFIAQMRDERWTATCDRGAWARSFSRRSACSRWWSQHRYLRRRVVRDRAAYSRNGRAHRIRRAGATSLALSSARAARRRLGRTARVAAALLLGRLVASLLYGISAAIR